MKKPSDKAVADLPGWLEEHRLCEGVTTLVDGSGLLCLGHQRTWTLEDGDGEA